ncbi:MAG: methyltransferase domain-containing protein [wastewater metagenome]|nr:methyltransferase domain-containing protein [Candidatus Loosdrechtia aerotolerans]
MTENYCCYNCNSPAVELFSEIKNAPVHSVLLMPDRETALQYPKRDIILGFCQYCGFIFNVAFDASMHEYSSRYEETQGFSPTFNTFHKNLANYLIHQYNLYNKDIIEIGCGKGEFLTMLCESGNNRGVGFDPSYIIERNQSAGKNRITFIKDFYSEKYAAYTGNFICCKMTLEHIQHTAQFLNTVKHSIKNRHNTIVFFQVPNVTPILREVGFWDIYYEHCSYFSTVSLARLFRKCGFDVMNLSMIYHDQYLMIEARMGSDGKEIPLEDEDDFEKLFEDVQYFSRNYQNRLDIWKRKVKEIIGNGHRIVIWGSGSKGVSFLNYLDLRDEIEFVVDINPYKHNMYMPGTGQKIVGPTFLKEYRPDSIIIMNPVYREEIQDELNRLGVTAELLIV